MMARICAVLLCCGYVLAFSASAKDASLPPLPERNPARVKPERDTSAKGKSEAKEKEGPVAPKDVHTEEWTEAQVTFAKEECAKLLAGKPIDHEPLPPIKEGLCGAPAPIRVRSIGSDPKVTIDPPATMRCAVADTVLGWLNTIVQPLAKERLGSPVVKLTNAAAYVCRNRYNGTKTPLSEHALANALDVSEFVLESGESVKVLDHWAKLEPETGTPPLPERRPVPPAPPAADAESSKPGHGKTTEVAKKKRAKTKPSKPKKPSEAEKARFLRFVHDGACETFGTVLGPESNEAHRDHFHLDKKARRRTNYCE
jgi:hypothetical protein